MTRDAAIGHGSGHEFGRRSCPACNAQSGIQTGEALWPPAWTCRACGHVLVATDGIVRLAPSLDDTNEGFDLDSFDLLPKVEPHHFWFVSRNELIGWLVRTYSGKARRVVEIGCGTGFVLTALRTALPDARIAGTELHSRGLVTARKRHGGNVELIQMDARATGLRSAVDLVGAFDVLEHIPEDDAVLVEIERMLAPGGLLIASVPQHPWLWSSADDVAHHQRRYKTGELARKAEAAGFEPIYRTSFVTLAFPLMALVRLAEKLSPKSKTLEEQHKSEFEISPLTNAILLWLCRVEHSLRRLGLPLPFGGSQILVARKRSTMTA